jgi:hypothetical protein
MTWGVIDGMETLKNYDVSLRELPTAISDIAYYGVNISTPRPTDWNNKLRYFIPLRKNEGAYEFNEGKYVSENYSPASLPVVPVAYIVKQINDYFGTKFLFENGDYKGSEHWDDTEKILSSDANYELYERGAVPLVKRDLTEKQYDARTGILKNVTVLNNSVWGIALTVWDDLKTYNVFSFDYVSPDTGDYYDTGNNGSTNSTKRYTFFKKNLAICTEVELDGYIKVVFSDLGTRYKNGTLDKRTTGETPRLIIYKRSFQFREDSDIGDIVYDEAASLDGTYVGVSTFTEGEYTYQLEVWKFDFRDSEGMQRITLDDFSSSSETYPYIMAIDHIVKETLEVSDFKIIPTGRMSDNIKNGWEVDVQSNLPDVGCLEFMKSLYYMLGAFPCTNADGYVVPNFYNSIFENLTNALDWSKKLLSKVSAVPEKIAYAIDGFGQKNYYLMKNDSLETSTSTERDDVYEAGMGVIVCDNETLETTKTIVQVPYYGAFLSPKERPTMSGYHDMKYTKYNDDGTTDFNEAKPAIGLVSPVRECTYSIDSNGNSTTVPKSTYGMILDIWDGFAHLDEHQSYKSLAKVMEKPIVITEYLQLNELDLRDLDYTVPIYLEKYNAYFAIVSIQRDSKGSCKCELIKLPEE